MRQKPSKKRLSAVNRAPASMIVLTRASIFTGGGLTMLAVLQVLGFDLSHTVEPGPLKKPLVMFVALLFSVGITAVIGAVLGFCLLSRDRMIATSRVLLLGALFSGLVWGSFVPAFDAMGIAGAITVFVALAATTAFVGGHVLSRNAPKASR